MMVLLSLPQFLQLLLHYDSILVSGTSTFKALSISFKYSVEIKDEAREKLLLCTFYDLCIS